MTIDLKGYQDNFFFDRAKVKDKVLDGKISALRRAGAYVRTVARRSIKKSRRLKESEMGPRQLKSFKARQKKYRRDKKAGRAGPYGPPKRPFKSAEPGSPPRSPDGFLKKFLLFGFDVARERVVVGPIKSKTGTVSALEHGGRVSLPNSRGKLVSMNFQGNPFMAPALKVSAPKLPEQFRHSIK